MKNTFRLSCESTVDLSYSYVSGRDISVIFYSYMLDGVEYEDNMGRDKDALDKFYNAIAAGKLPTTSQINKQRFIEYFEPMLKEGDVLHVSISSGLTLSVDNAMAAAAELREKYPHRRIVIIDSTCGSFGYGILMDGAANMRDRGSSMDDIERWIMSERKNIQHQFFTTDVKYFKRSGRVSGATATVASVLGICPLMHLDYDGNIIAYDKARGKQNVMLETVNEIERNARGGKDYSGPMYVAHSDCIEDAKAVADMLIKRFPKLHGNLHIVDLGTIIASHCGPGTIAIFFEGRQREKTQKRNAAKCG